MAVDAKLVGVVVLLLCAFSRAVSKPPDWLVYNVTTKVRTLSSLEVQTKCSHVVYDTCNHYLLQL